MKKLLIIMTLFMSSFFLTFNNKVKAEEIVVNYDFDINEYITEDFLMVRDKVLEYLPTSGYNNYFIYYRDDGSTYYPYRIYLFNSDSISTDQTGATFYFYNLENKIIYVSKETNEIVQSSSSTSLALAGNTFYQYLAGNVKIFLNKKVMRVNYQDLIYLVDSENSVPFMYDIYKTINDIPEDNSHQEEMAKVTSFYNMFIEKLQYLSEILVSNYIYLSVIVIFILVFIFKLIFRRW